MALHTSQSNCLHWNETENLVVLGDNLLANQVYKH